MVKCPHCGMDFDLTQKALTRKQTELLSYILVELERISDVTEKINLNYVRLFKNEHWLIFICEMVIAHEKKTFEPYIILSIMKEVLDHTVPEWREEFNATIEFRNSLRQVIKKIRSQ